MAGPLSHLRVLDLSRVLAGPWATQNLGDLGAEVIKIERPGNGDDTRGWGPPFLRSADSKDSSEAAYFLSVNRNKKSVTLDIPHPLGGTAPGMASPLRLSGTPVEYRLAPPLLGQHSDEVLKGLLGKSDAELATLRASGIV